MTAADIERLRRLPAPDRLAWIIKNEWKENLEKAGKRFGVSDVGLLKWIHPKEELRRRPKWPRRMLIQSKTRRTRLGPIKPEEWGDADERRLIARSKAA